MAVANLVIEIFEVMCLVFVMVCLWKINKKLWKCWALFVAVWLWLCWELSYVSLVLMLWRWKHILQRLCLCFIWLCLLLYLSVIQKIQSKPRRKTVESLVRFCSFFILKLDKISKYFRIPDIVLFLCLIFKSFFLCVKCLCFISTILLL